MLSIGGLDGEGGNGDFSFLKNELKQAPERPSGLRQG